jgi:CRP-like cAMP-binding protein
MADLIECKQGCGKTFEIDGAWRAKHELKCKGPVATEGRIAARNMASGSATVIDVKALRQATSPRKAAKRSKGRVAKAAHKMSDRRPRHADRTPPAATERAYGSSRAEVIAELKERRDHINVAIAALEAVG